MHWKIFVCGDTHWFSLYEYDAKKLNPKFWKESQFLTKDDVLIQLGDFWYLWYPLIKEKELEKLEKQVDNYKKQLSNLNEGTNEYETIKNNIIRLKIYIKRNYKNIVKQRKTLDKLASLNYTIAVVPWNHENYNEIFSLPEIEKWWAKVWELKRKTGSIYFLKRWEVYQINWKTIFAIWWALSIDKAWREEEKSWWMLEYLCDKEIKKVLENTEKYKAKWVDYILTHTCPISIARKLVNYWNEWKLRDEVSDLLEMIIYKSWINFKQWHFWHFHKDIVIYDENNEAKFFCHYNNKPMKLG